MTPDEAFDRDVTESMREDVLTMICEAVHDENHGYKDVQIFDRDYLDIINVRANGTVKIGDNEYTFIAESGNWNGFRLEDWNGDKEFEALPKTQWALAPKNDFISSAVVSGRGPLLIAKWDAIASRPNAAEIISGYTYDRHFQPGGLTEKHFKDRAEKLGFQIVDSEHAEEIRQRLLKAKEPVPCQPT